MTPSTRASRGALLLFAGGVASAVAPFLPWARLSVVSVRGISTPWGVATFAAGVVGALAGYRISRGHRPRLAIRLVVIAAGVVAVAVPAAVAGELGRSLVEERLDARLARYGLTAADVLGAEGHPSLFERFAPFGSRDTAQLVEAMKQSTTIRADAGLWIALAGGMAMSAGAAAASARRQRHHSTAPEPGVMTTNATITVTGMTCGGCARRVRSAIGDLPGVDDVAVELATGTVSISGDTDIDEPSVRTAIEAAGYGVAS